MNNENPLSEKTAEQHNVNRISKVELISIALFILALLLFLFSLPGGAALMILSLGFLSILYFYFGFALLNGIPLRKIFKKSSYSSISSMRIVGAIGTGIGLSTAIIGVLFKFMSWPGSYFMLIIGLLFVSVFFFYSLVKLFMNQSAFYINIICRVAFFGGIGLLLLLLPSYTLSEIRYGKNHPEYIEALKALESDPTNEILQDNVTIEHNKIRRLSGERIKE
jgi:hypothetical protein